MKNCYCKYHDLKADIYLEIYFDSPDDMIIYFSKYNPMTIHIVEIDAFQDGDSDD